ncbi:DUF742 domain-containing protein [Streptomyces sp. ISL-12]|uniref:DUF742 domain-containing protein n=1 Tax=Streptomyces sp. ISL-12 TaxID=2819177 RepID=UPI001BE74377|nr:DUF742 domain-containing protein [Streptomyces sp. ISL-12]MBT2413969.1 DUF742 domain-containing protein [Streptomyces sp. ISL-12]
MSTGGGPSGPGRDREAEDEQTFADVLNAFSLGTGRRRRKISGRRDTPPDGAREDSGEALPSPAPEPYGPASRTDYQPWDAGDTGDGEPGAPASFVRAYAWTGGRTRSHHHFEVETLVTATDPTGAPVAATQWDHAVLDLCREPRSVAEVAALVAVPLGVAKVLLGDLADRGLIVVHEAATDFGDVPTHALMERVLIGLRQL